MNTAKQNITISVQVKELLFDIMSKTYLTGQAQNVAKTKDYEASAYIQVSDDDEQSYQIRRSITNVFAELKTLLSEHLKENKTSSSNKINSAVEIDDILTLTLEMPSNYDNVSIDLLASAIHDYIVYKTIAEWYALVDKTGAADNIAFANQALILLQQALFKRTRPTYPTE